MNIITSTSDLQTLSNIKIYPNPFSNFLNIESNLNQKVLLFNVHGSVVYDGDINELKSTNLQNLNPGNYYLRIQKTQKIIKLIKVNEE